MKEKEVQNDMSVSFENCCVVNGERWFFANEFNALCCMNEHNEIVFKALAPGENDSSIYLFADIKYSANKIFLIPRGASALLVYDIENKAFKRYEIQTLSSTSKNPYIDYLKFSIGVIHGEKLYMIPRTYPAIVVFDIKNESLQYETRWIELINDRIFEGEAFFWADYSISNNELVLACANSDCVVRRSFITNEYSVKHIPNEKRGFSGIEIVDNQMFLCSRKDGQIICVDGNGGVERLLMPEGFHVGRIIGYSKLLRLGDYLYAIPMWSNYFIRIKIGDHKIVIIKDYDSERQGNEEVATCCAWIEGNSVCLDNNLRHVIDVFMVEGDNSIIGLSIGKEFCEDRMRYMIKRGEIVHENKQNTLADFLDFIKKD